MPKLTYRTCKGCGLSTDEVGVLSHTRLCATCGVGKLSSNVEQMHARRGPNWDLWRRNMAACVGASLLDEPPRVVQGDASGY